MEENVFPFLSPNSCLCASVYLSNLSYSFLEHYCCNMQAFYKHIRKLHFCHKRIKLYFLFIYTQIRSVFMTLLRINAGLLSSLSPIIKLMYQYGFHHSFEVFRFGLIPNYSGSKFHCQGYTKNALPQLLENSTVTWNPFNLQLWLITTMGCRETWALGQLGPHLSQTWNLGLDRQPVWNIESQCDVLLLLCPAQKMGHWRLN